MNNGRSYSLVDLPDIDTDYIMLESMLLDETSARDVHILHPKARHNRAQFAMQRFERVVRPYLIGRDYDCDVQITDISVSRSHC